MGSQTHVPGEETNLPRHALPKRAAFLDAETGLIRSVTAENPLPTAAALKSPSHVTGAELASMARDVGDIKSMLSELLVHVREMTGLKLSCGDY